MLGVCNPKPIVVRDSRGRTWPALEIVRGECDDHLLPIGSWDGPMRWESQRIRPYVTASRANTLRGLAGADDAGGPPTIRTRVVVAAVLGWFVFFGGRASR